MLEVLGAGLILTSFNDIIAKYAPHFNFKIFNNEAGYETLLVGLRLA